MNKNVALVLSSGGPRGFAYIGAIEELIERGYTITSVAGTSIGSLVGGIYAAGKLPEFKEWIFSLNSWDVFSLMDLSLSMNHFVKGEKIINAMKEIVPDVSIEDMAIPFSAIATDLYTGEEVVFDHGKLFTAIRASISIPSLFRPVKHGITTLIDGGIANCLPLNRVKRTDNDILVAFDVNNIDIHELREILTRENNNIVARETFQRETKEELHELIRHVKERTEISLVKRLKYAGSRSINLLKDMIEHRRNDNDESELDYGDTYYALLERTFSLMNHTNTKLALQLYRPDVLVQMPFDAYGQISDYAKANEIAELGRRLMHEALNHYEESNIA